MDGISLSVDGWKSDIWNMAIECISDLTKHVFIKAHPHV